MIQIREVVLIYPGRMKEAVELAKETRNTRLKNGIPVKIVTDLSSEFYSLIFEIEVKSFDDYLELNKNIHATDGKNGIAASAIVLEKGKGNGFL